MREFVFVVNYQQGIDDEMDVFIEYPAMRARTLACHVTPSTMWRLDLVTGPARAIDTYESVLTDLSHCTDVLGRTDSGPVDWRYEVVSRTPTRRLMYFRHAESTGSRSIPYVAANHLGDGLLCRAERSGHTYEWRILLEDDTTVRMIYEEIEEILAERDGVSVAFDQLGEPDHWTVTRFKTDELPAEQQAALEAAVEYGYYDRTRQTTVQELAADLDIPRFTLQYRLNQAEAWLARQFVAETTHSGTTIEAEDALAADSSTSI
jgi:predicted DNA binding protein